jgi:phytoene dehydrogenase-like protein
VPQANNSQNVIIVGGGLAGLAAALFLARGGRNVTIFEKRRNLGGRAVTHLRQGYRFNLGAHALYRTGGAASVYRELGIPLRGGAPKPSGIAMLDGEQYRLPLRIGSLIASGLLSLKGKAELAALMIRIRRIDPKKFEHLTARQWLDEHISDDRLRQLVEALIRLSSYTNNPEALSAAIAVGQLKLSVRGALYLDEGWQKLIDALHSAAVSAGVNFVSSSRIIGVGIKDGTVQSVELGGLELDAHRADTLSVALPEIKPDDVQGASLRAGAVLLAVDPVTATELVEDARITQGWAAAKPVNAACLDVALSKLPNPKLTFALGIDQPHYFSVHSQWAQLTPRGGALIHIAKYQKEGRVSDDYDDVRGARSNADEAEMEELLDRLQPGWRDVLVHRRFLPSMTVSNALITPGMKRPEPVTPVRGLYLAGDWVGDGGFLSDAALTSARAAAKAILASA